MPMLRSANSLRERGVADRGWVVGWEGWAVRERECRGGGPEGGGERGREGGREEGERGNPSGDFNIEV